MAALLRAAVRTQSEITRHKVMDHYWLLLIPLYALIFMSVFIQSGRTDLLGYALVGPLLIAIGQMGFYAASELVGNEREMQTLELQVASPSPLVLVIAARVAVVSSFGVAGFLEAWLVARLAFGIAIGVAHPLVLAVTLVATTFAATATSILFSALFALKPGRMRSLQAAFTTPVYVLAGIVVPVAVLPGWVQPISRVIFLSWSADLLRDAIRPGAIDAVGPRLAVILALGAAGLVAGAVTLRRMVDHLRAEGTFGL